MDIYILHDGQQNGPFSEETARQMLKQGVVRGTDPAWRTGMPEWLPLDNILHSEESQAAASEAPAPEASTTASPTEEHPTSKTERPQRFFELCQTQGAEVIEGITRAHCQVLVGYLDGKFPNWDAGDENEAARKYFFPAVAEKFPQFVRQGWKEKLRYPQPSQPASTPKPRVAAPPKASTPPARKATSPTAAFFKGFVFGLAIVAVAVGGMVAYKRPDLVENAKAQLQAKFSGNAKATTQETAAEAVPANPEVKPSSSTATADSTAKQDAPAKASTKKRTAAAAKAPSQETAAEMANSIPAPELPTAPAPGSTSTALFDPSPSPKPAAAGTAMASESATGLPAPKTSVKLLQALELQSTYGKIQIPAGSQLPIVEQDGANVKVRFQNQIVSVPATSTDLGESGLQQ